MSIPKIVFLYLYLSTIFIAVAGLDRYLVQFDTQQSFKEIHDKIVKSDRLHRSFPRYLIDVIYLDKDEENDWKNIPGLINFEEDRYDQVTEQGQNAEVRNRHRNKQRYASEEIIPYGIDMVNKTGISENYISNQKICIIDTGYDIKHPDLPSDVTGTSVIDGLEWNVDVNGHGTHVAGTIAALGGNGQGVVGILSTGKVQLHITRAKDDEGGAYESEIIAAFQDCEASEANIINYSGGQIIPSSILESVLEILYEEKNTLIFTAAGNGGSGSIIYPAFYSGAISVGAVDDKKKKPFASSTNKNVELAGPGVDVLSTLPNNAYGYESGTSMACPHATAVAALIWSHFPNKSASEIRRYLQLSASDLGPEGRDKKFGFGLIDAGKAFHMLSNDIPFPPTVSPTEAPTRTPCPNTNSIILIEFLTDPFGDETSWELVDMMQGDGGKTIETGSNYAGNTFFTFTFCVPCSSYQFRFLDNYGDGNEGGFYIVTVDDEIILSQVGKDFGYEQNHFFIPEKCQGRGFTLAPTKAPTLAPTKKPTITKKGKLSKKSKKSKSHSKSGKKKSGKASKANKRINQG